MKCIRCGRDSKYRERAHQRCPGCKSHFAFEPQKGDLLTDAAFQAAIEAVSANGRVRWGVEHLYYEICRRRLRGRWISKAGYVVAFVFVWLLGVLTGSVVLAFALAALTCLALWGLSRWLRPGATVPVPLETFNAMWARWQEVHHPRPKGVIVRQQRGSRFREPEPELGLYSFDRAVICDRARTADLL
ncbi:MAG: hypothetical protein ACRELA_01610, partial [Candidatus Rokuibacteriota bacterium]